MGEPRPRRIISYVSSQQELGSGNDGGRLVLSKVRGSLRDTEVRGDLGTGRLYSDGQAW